MKKLFTKIFILFFIVGAFSYIISERVSAQAQRADNDCLSFFFSNPTVYIQDPLGLRPNLIIAPEYDKDNNGRITIDEASAICTLPESDPIGVDFANYSFCDPSCDYNTHYCLKFYDKANPSNSRYSCELKIDNSKCGTCDPSDPDNDCQDPLKCSPDEECKIQNPIAHYASTLVLNPTREVNGQPVSLNSEIWACAEKEEFVNVFGINMGPFNEAVVKIIRTVLAGVLAVVGIWSGFTLFWAIWQTTQRTPESYENIQKTVTNSILGLIFTIMGFFAIQFVSGLFGVSGNIFAFTYTP